MRDEMKGYIRAILFIVLSFPVLWGIIYVGGKAEKRRRVYTVTKDTNVSQIKGLSKYVTQEEIDDFAFRYADIAKDKEENETLKPLREALERGDTRGVIEYLKEHNLSADVRMLDKRTPLMYSAFHNDVNTTRALIEMGADIKAKDRYGLIAMGYAIENNATEAVKELLSHGARFEDVEFIQSYLPTAMYGNIGYLIIDERNNTKIIYGSEVKERLPRSKNKIPSFLWYVIWNNMVDMFKVIMESGYKPNMKKYHPGPLPGIKECNQRNVFYASVLVEIPNYKPLMELGFKYFGEPDEKYLKEAYEYCRKEYKRLKRLSKNRGFYEFVSNIWHLKNDERYCSEEGGEFTPRSYFAWANEHTRIKEIYNFMTQPQNKKKVFHITKDTNLTEIYKQMKLKK
jgi:hypothetical protein